MRVRQWQLKSYSSDLTDAEWKRIEPLLPEDKLVGRLREVDLREVLKVISSRQKDFYKFSITLLKACRATIELLDKLKK